MFVDFILSRIDIDGAAERGVRTEQGVSIGTPVDLLRNRHHINLEKIPTDGDGYTLIVTHHTMTLKSIAYFIEGNKVTWLYAGTVSALKRPEDCL